MPCGSEVKDIQPGHWGYSGGEWGSWCFFFLVPGSSYVVGGKHWEQAKRTELCFPAHSCFLLNVLCT